MTATGRGWQNTSEESRDFRGLGGTRSKIAVPLRVFVESSEGSCEPPQARGGEVVKLRLADELRALSRFRRSATFDGCSLRCSNGKEFDYSGV